MLDQFIEITRSMIESDGLDGFLPTLLLPRQNTVGVLDDLPDDDIDEQVATGWATEIAGEEEACLLAYKLDSDHFKAVARIDGQRQEQSVRV